MARLSDFLPKLYFPLLAVLCFVFAWQPLQGIDDFWAHAAIGRWIAQHGEVPRQTLFVWAPGTPIPWIYHSWLSQLTFFKLLDWGGDEARGASFALLLTYAIAVTTLAWMWLIWAKRARITALTPFLFAIALWCSSPRFHPRPELFSGLFLCAVLIYLLVWTEARAGNNLPSHYKWRTVGLALLFALWTNFHGGVAVGLVFIALTIFGEIIQDILEKRSKRPTLFLCGALALCALSINLNPYGIAYWSALRPVGGAMFSLINEWKPLWKPPLMEPEAFIVTGLLLVLALSSWAKNPNRRIAHLLWLIYAAFAYLMARRQIQQFAQVSIIIMAANAAALETRHFWKTWTKKEEIPLTARFCIRISAVIGLLCALPGVVPQDFLPLHSLSPRLPTRAAHFIEKNLQNSRLFTDYASSSYLNWHLAGKPPVFIDLINAYPDHLLADYFDAVYLKPQGLKMLDDVGVTHIFIKKPADEKTTQFADYMKRNSKWQAVYSGNDATIWRRIMPSAGNNREGISAAHDKTTH